MKKILLMVLYIPILMTIIGGCTPDYKNKDPKIRKVAIEKITDQNLLVKIVFEDSDELVREAAVLRLTDQALLSKIAIEHKIAEVRITAINCLTDPVTLEKIVVNVNESILLRQFANQKLQKLTGVQKFSFK